ncbi:MAG: hypothetical protein IJF36_01545 [Oscillibacter sp.]|nr:hypothetical protein [Oscillibacter sp.]
MEVRGLNVQRCLDLAPLRRLLLLSGLFLLGIVLGRSMALRVSEAALAEVESYLMEYFLLEEVSLSETVLSTLFLYFRYPLAAFLLGFVPIGAILLPLTGLLFAFFLSFSVCCYTAVFGAGGVLLALAMFGLRCILTIPCFFLLAVPALGEAEGLMVTGKRGKRVVDEKKACWLRLTAAIGVLFMGALADLMISPRLLKLVLQYLLI